MPDMAIVVVPHPIGGINPEEVVKKADEALEEIIKAITT